MDTKIQRKMTESQEGLGRQQRKKFQRVGERKEFKRVKKRKEKKMKCQGINSKERKKKGGGRKEENRKEKGKKKKVKE